jgi:hypothetical protein
MSREDFEVVVVVVDVRGDSLYITPVERMMAEVVPAANRNSGSIVSNCEDVGNNAGDSSIQHGMLSRTELWLSLTMHLVALKAFLNLCLSNADVCRRKVQLNPQSWSKLVRFGTVPELSARGPCKSPVKIAISASGRATRRAIHR